MKILGINSFNSKNGDHWLVVSGVQKFSFPQGKAGFENCEHWFRNPDQNIIDMCKLGNSIDVLYRKEGNRTVAFSAVEIDDDIKLEF